MKLNADHVRFVLKCLAENTAPVRNMKQYLLAALYNAPTTMQLYYLNQANHDLWNREGTPQGGIISPILANMTLDGIEKKLVERFHTNALGKVDLRFKNAHKVNFVRYADDFVVTAATPELALEAKKLIREFLVKRGLELSDEKTVVTNIDDGFDFLRLLTASRMIWNSTKL